MVHFQKIKDGLDEFWDTKGCIIRFGCDLEVAYALQHPAAFFNLIKKDRCNIAYLQKCRRNYKDDSFDKNYTLNTFHQYKVIIRDFKNGSISLLGSSFKYLGIKIKEHKSKFMIDSFSIAPIGVFGNGWKIFINGVNVGGVHYIENIVGKELNPAALVISYGLERLSMALQRQTSIYDTEFSQKCTIRDMLERSESEHSRGVSVQCKETLASHFKDFKEEAENCISNLLPIPAYDFTTKAYSIINKIYHTKDTVDYAGKGSMIFELLDINKRISQLYSSESTSSSLTY